MENTLPKNWVNTKFTDILDIKGGSQPPKSEFIDEPKEGYIRLLQIRDFGDKPVPTYVPIKENQLTCIENDILIARYGASIGRIVTGMKGTYNVALAKVITPKQIPINYIKWYLKSDIFQKPITSTQRTAQNGFNKEDLESVPFPLPPLPEQERIVAKLDALFAQHEKMKQALDKIPQLLKDFRQQVLTQAVTGEVIQLKNVLKDIKYGTSKKSDYDVDGIPILRIPNIVEGIVDDRDLKFSQLDDKEFDSLKLVENDILIIRSNGSITLVGQSAIVTKEFENYCYAGYLIRIRLNEEYCAKYLNYIFKSNFIRNQMIDTSKGMVGINNINSKQIQNLNIPNLNFKEQQEIVARVESLFAKADVIEARYQTLKEKIDNLPQVILHKAFKGELVPQLQTDGDVKDLLAEIIQLKEEAKPKKAKKKK